MKRVSSGLVVALVAIALVPVTSHSPASASVTLPIGTAQDLVVDQAHGRVFISGKKVAVANLSGALLGTIDGFANAAGMSLSADGSKLLVLEGSAIKVVDPVSSTVVDTVLLGDTVCPARLAPSSGKVFFSYKTCADSGQPDQLGAVDLNTDTVTTALLPGEWRQLIAVPGKPDVLAALASDTVALLATTGGTTPTASIAASTSTTGYYSDLSVAPDGSKLVVGHSEPGFQGFNAYSTTDLVPGATYPLTSPSGGDPGSVAIRADGRLAVTWGDSGYSYLRTYKPGSTTPFSNKRYPRGQAPGLMGFGTTYLYGAFKKSTTSATSLEVYTAGPAAKLTLSTNHSAYPWKGDATVVATLGSPTTSRKVAIFAKSAGGTERLIKSGTVSATGKLIAAVPDLKVNTTFRAVFKSDGSYDSASVSKAVTVAAKVTLTSRSTSTSGIYHRLSTSPTPAVKGQLYAGAGGGCVRVIGYRLVSGAWHRFDSIECIHQSGSRSFVVGLYGFKRGDKLKITARYQGSAGNAPSPAATYYVLVS